MKKTLLLFLAASSCIFAQSQAPEGVHLSVGGASPTGRNAVVQGAPFSATITNKSVRTLEDGNQIVATSTGTMARDSEGRTRQDVPLPEAGPGKPSATRLVLIQDPVAHTAYALDFADKTAHQTKFSSSPSDDRSPRDPDVERFSVAIAPDGPPDAPLVGQALFATGPEAARDEPNHVVTEDLGSQTIEGMLVNGTRTTRTIPAGEIGNREPIKVVTEVWTSPDLNTVISSKQTDPLTGEETFELTNIVRTEPDPSLFKVPADFEIVEGPSAAIHRTNP